MVQTGTYFSSIDDVQAVILKVLDSATQDIKVAVAWFTDKTLFAKLIEKQRNNVNVSMIMANHEINHNCGIDFDELAEIGGEVILMGNGDDGLMHNKFCVVDYNTVCMGSYNWTYSANNRNQESLDVSVGNLKKVEGFVQEFERLKEMSGHVTESSVPDLSETLQIFSLIKAFINLNQPNMITPYIFQLESFSEVKHIVEVLKEQDYSSAIRLMDEFTSNYTRPVSVTQQEITATKFKIQYIAYQLEGLEASKIEVETEVEQFKHYYVLQLNPTILKILEIKKKIYNKLRKYGVEDSSYEDLEEEFKNASEEYNQEEQNPIPTLNEDDSKTIKQLHREGAALCHPDSPNCVYKDKTEAAQMFDLLSKAYKANNLDRVQELVQEMRLGKVVEFEDKNDELELLKAKLVTLEQKYKRLLEELVFIKSSEDYQNMPPRDQWENYFMSAKEQLKQQYKALQKQFTHPKA